MVAVALSHLLFGPLLGAGALLAAGRSLGVRGAAALLGALGLGQLAALAALAATLGVGGGGAAAGPAAPLLLWSYGAWFGVGELEARWGFLLDGLALPMASLVVAVSLATQAYSFWYLAQDPALLRFQSYLNLFTAAMVALVTADNFGVFFLGWEGVGCCSYLLIGFWCSRPEARSAALKAVAVNRIGDAAFLAAVGLLASLSGGLAFGLNFGLLPLFGAVALPLPGGGSLGLLPLANGLLLVAIAAKSAQLGLHGWLADAMEGPTPVSALIHAATMVTAGIYLALRCSSLFALTPAVGEAMALLGGATALFGAAVAAAQWDLKKVIAYSTASQLGYMLCGCGLGGYSLAFQHLVAHGFFKALLFLAAGVLIHALGGEQDLRRLGGLGTLLPATAGYLLVGFGALLGLPGTSGSCSKERLLELAAGAGGGVGAACHLLLTLALVGTAFYSAKTLSYALRGVYRGGRGPLAALAAGTAAGREQPRWLPLPLGTLVLLTLATEVLYAPLSRPLGGAFLAASLGPAPGGLAPFADALATPNRWLPLAALALGVAAFGAAEAAAGSWLRRSLGLAAGAAAGGRWARELARSWQRGFGFDGALCALAFGALGRPLGAALALEKGLLEWLGPYGLGSLLTAAARRLELLHLGRSAFGHLGLLALAYGALLAAAALAAGAGAALGGGSPPALRGSPTSPTPPHPPYGGRCPSAPLRRFPLRGSRWPAFPSAAASAPGLLVHGVSFGGGLRSRAPVPFGGAMPGFRRRSVPAHGFRWPAPPPAPVLRLPPPFTPFFFLPPMASAPFFTAALSAAASAGSPLLHRGWAGAPLASPLEQFEIYAAAAGGLRWGWLALGSAAEAALPPLLLLGGLLALAGAAPRLVGGGWLQSAAEAAVRSLGDFLVANAGRAQLPALPLLLTLALALALYNLSGLLPYGYTFTAHLLTTLFYAFSVFYGLNHRSLLHHGRAYFNLFAPGGTPLPLLPLLVLLELVSYFSRPLSLAIRLFANLMAGHALLKILLTFGFGGLFGGALPALLTLAALAIIGAVLLLELMVALLQVFVFVTLVCLYLADAHNPAAHL